MEGHDDGFYGLTGNSYSRRTFLAGAISSAAAFAGAPGVAGESASAQNVNVAPVAIVTSLTTTSENKIDAVNDGFLPTSSQDRTHGAYMLRGEWEASDTPQWIQYVWDRRIRLNRVEVYWAVDKPHRVGPAGSEFTPIMPPASYRVLYWNGSEYMPVSGAAGLSRQLDTFNVTTFETVTTDRVRLEVSPEPGHAAGVLEWRVIAAGEPPPLPPLVHAGVDRSVVLDGQTYLTASAKFLLPDAANITRWSKLSGPGDVVFESAKDPVTTAHFSKPGEYQLQISAVGAKVEARAAVRVRVEPAPPTDRLDVVYTTPYSIDSPLWNERARSLIVNWIPHCIKYCERTDIAPGQGDGGLDNFIEAAKANRNEPHAPHKGFVFSNAWVHQTVESMCIALMIDAQGDAEIVAAQLHMRATLERWIPIILAAQMPDGYLQTAYILARRAEWPERWMPEHRGNHEGYVSGYFIESAINHYTLTGGTDLRMYDAAKRLADCWVANIGPGRKEWFDGHQEMEQALVRFGRFVNDQEGSGRGDSYILLAKFLLDSRRGGSEYDQSHLPPGKQYEAVGHAVRAMYFYSGMADIAAETHDKDYQSAVLSLWDNMVNRKFYVTGGIGSGETSEGFGPNYSLRNNAYCESCSSCGLIFFQYKLNLAYHDARYADLYEQTMYNALLGGVDLSGTSFCYTNPLVNTRRTLWHECPCCVGNIPRTLLMVPTWAYAKSHSGLYVNLFIGSTVNVGKVAGVPVQMIQRTRYPWEGSVAIIVNPEQTHRFDLRIRIPNRQTSALYTHTPSISGYHSLKINGELVKPSIEKGYAVLDREWKRGDTVELDLPMEPQRVTADARVRADLGSTALMYGPLVYNVETADQPSIDRKLSAAPVQAVWRPTLLGGVVTLESRWDDGTPFTAVPHFARMNRVGPPTAYLSDPEIDYAPGTTAVGAAGPGKVRDSVAPATPVIIKPGAGTGNITATPAARGERPRLQSKVWI